MNLLTTLWSFILNIISYWYHRIQYFPFCSFIIWSYDGTNVPMMTCYYPLMMPITQIHLSAHLKSVIIIIMVNSIIFFVFIISIHQTNIVIIIIEFFHFQIDAVLHSKVVSIHERCINNEVGGCTIAMYFIPPWSIIKSNSNNFVGCFH